MKPFSDRDLLVAIALILISGLVAFTDSLIELDPSERDGVIDFLLVAGVGWGFYMVGKSSGGST